MADRLAVGALVLGSLLASSAGDAQAPDPFASVVARDPMELTRAVRAAGDDAVLERLAGVDAPPVRLAAIHAAPYMVGPERALDALASIAGGRDPDLAPAAARSALAIARGLGGDDLSRREVMPETLRPARARLAALAADPGARTDVAGAARLAALQLAAAGITPE